MASLYNVSARKQRLVVLTLVTEAPELDSGVL